MIWLTSFLNIGGFPRPLTSIRFRLPLELDVAAVAAVIACTELDDDLTQALRACSSKELVLVLKPLDLRDQHLLLAAQSRNRLRELLQARYWIRFHSSRLCT